MNPSKAQAVADKINAILVDYGVGLEADRETRALTLVDEYRRIRFNVGDGPRVHEIVANVSTNGSGRKRSGLRAALLSWIR